MVEEMRLFLFPCLVAMLIMILTIANVNASGVCMDGIKDVNEQCDDGNRFLMDGCSTTCELEDPSMLTWMCTTVDGTLSECCPVMMNPVTNDKVCDCANAAQPVAMGFNITADCRKRDINECNTNHGGCHPKAVCINYDAAVDSLKTYECECPPGWNGDGVSSCDINTYETEFKFVEFGVASTDTGVVASELQSVGVIPTEIDTGNIHAVSAPYFFAAAARRRLLSTQTGVEITVKIMSDSLSAMDALTNNINTTALPLEYTLTSAPISTVLVSGRGLVNTMLGGFAVDSIIFSAVTNTWEIDSRYHAGIPNTIASPYVSKIRASPSQAEMETFEISKFPCLNTPSVCCLNDYTDDYITGAFATDVALVVGACGTDIQAIDTVTMFNDTVTQVFVPNLMKDYPNSRVSGNEPGRFQMSLAANDVKNSFSRRTDFPDGHYELRFFVGMAYFTLLPAPVISTTASQVTLTVSVSPTLTFAFSSQQQYTFVQYLTMAVYQNKYMDANFVTYNMQFVSMALVLPAGLLQNMQTGLVPLNSIRWAVAKTMPDRTDTVLWNNPCYSGDGSGMYDDGNDNGSGTTWEDMYKNSAAQSCAFSRTMCINPPVAILANRLAQFHFPIGDDEISTIKQNDGQYRLFVTFELSVVDTDGASIITDVFTEAPITRYVIPVSSTLLLLYCLGVEAFTHVRWSALFGTDTPPLSEFQ